MVGESNNKDQCLKLIRDTDSRSAVCNLGAMYRGVSANQFINILIQNVLHILKVVNR